MTRTSKLPIVVNIGENKTPVDSNAEMLAILRQIELNTRK